MELSIPGYKLDRVLGKGGMATVYLAIQEIFEREVALKVMDTTLAEDPSFGQRFLREAKIVSQLVHPNIITVFDVGVHHNFYYLSMEYIAGPDLKRGRQSLTLRQKLSVIRDVAEALAYAAQKGIVHRDIKSENILLRQPSGQAVLMDFGIARAAESDLSMTQTGAALGTPHYMSPEQARGDPVDQRSDLYSLGVVFYFLLMGTVPYRGDSAVSVGIKHLTEPLPLLPKALQALQHFIDRLMAKDPAQRFQSAQELIAEIDHVDLSTLPQRDFANRANNTADRFSLADNEATIIHSQIMADQEGKTELDLVPGVVEAAMKLNWTPWLLLAGIILGVSLGFQWFVREPGTVTEERAQSVADEGSLFSFPWPDLEGYPRQGDHADSDTIFRRLNSTIKNIAKRQPDQQSDLDQQALAVRKEIAQFGASPQRKNQLKEIAQEAFAEVYSELNQGQFTDVQRKLERYQSLFAEHWGDDSEEKTVINTLLQNSEQLLALQGQAELAMAENRFVQPEGHNALFYYWKMLQLQPNYGAAMNGLRELLDTLQQRVENFYDTGDWGKAYAENQYVLLLIPQDPRARELKTIIESYQLEENSVAQWLIQAQDLQQAGHLYTPTENNAYAFYQKILSLRPEHQAAQQGLLAVQEQFSSAVSRLLAQGDVAVAREQVTLALSIAGEQEFLKDLHEQLQRVEPLQRVSQNRRLGQVSGPMIRALVVSDTPIDNISIRQERKLARGKTLYGALVYQGFSNNNQVLYAVLTTAAGQAVDKVPLVISTDSGELRFRIDHAVNTFAKGRYRLKLMADEQLIAETEFSILL